MFHNLFSKYCVILLLAVTALGVVTIEGCTLGKPQSFKTWKTITLGTVQLKTEDDLRRALEQGGYEFHTWGKNIFLTYSGSDSPEFTVVAKETTIELINVSAQELGLKHASLRRDIYKRARELGLNLCPAEVGPQLRLQYGNQPFGETLSIAMEPVGSEDSTSIFELGHGGLGDGQWLLVNSDYPEFSFPIDERWIFCR